MRDVRPPWCPLVLAVWVEVADFKGVRDGMMTGCECGGILAVVGWAGLRFSLSSSWFSFAVWLWEEGVSVLASRIVGLLRVGFDAIFSERDGDGDEGEEGGWR